MTTATVTKFLSSTAKSYATKAGVRYYAKDERWHDFKYGVKLHTSFIRTSEGWTHMPIGFKYFGGKDMREVTILKMRLWLTEQGIKYRMSDNETILIAEVN